MLFARQRNHRRRRGVTFLRWTENRRVAQVLVAVQAVPFCSPSAARAEVNRGGPTSRCRRGKKPEQASQRAVPRSKAWQHFHLCEKALANDCGEEGRGRGRGPRQEKTAAPPPPRRSQGAFGGAFRGLDAAEENETQRLDVARCVLDVGHRGKEGHSVRDEKSERCTSLHACSDARAACACSGLCNC